MFETKEILRENLSRAKEQLISETSRAASLARDLSDRDAELIIARDALKDTRHRLAESYNQNQKQERTLNDLRRDARKNSAAANWTNVDSPDTPPTLSRSTTSDSMSSGLRELRLGRTPSQKAAAPPPQGMFAKRTSSLATQSVLAAENLSPADNEALLLELVNAKTAEAVARQELEELKGRFDGMRRVVSGVAQGSPVGTPSPAPKEAQNAAGAGAAGWGWGGWKRTVSSSGIGGT